MPNGMERNREVPVGTRAARLRRVVAMPAVFASLLFAAGCDNSRAAWDQAVAQNTTASYQDFIRKYPRSEQATAAQARLSELDDKEWKNATGASDVDTGLKEYLRLFPTGKRATKAQTTLALRGTLPTYFSKETDKVRAAITEAIVRRLSLGTAGELLVGQPVFIGVDPHAARSLVLCSVAQGMKPVAGDTVQTARLVFDLRRSDAGAWSAAVGQVSVMGKEQVGEEMSPLLGPIQLLSGEWQVFAVVWPSVALGG